MENKLSWSIQQGTIELPVYVVGEPLDTIIDSIKETNEKIQRVNEHLETVHLKQDDTNALLENLVSLQQTQIEHFETLLSHQQTIIDNQATQQQELTTLNETSNNIYEKLMRVYPESTGYEVEPNPIELVVGETVNVSSYETFSDGTRTQLDPSNLTMEENDFATFENDVLTAIAVGETELIFIDEEGNPLITVPVTVTESEEGETE